MSETPFYISIGALTAALLIQTILVVVREIQHQRVVAGLIDKLLVERGVGPLPDDHPLADAISTVMKRNEAEKAQSQPQRIRIPIPGAAAFNAMTKGRK